MKKKGELTTKQLVTIIILIVSFVIILFLIFRLNLGETTDKQVCHNSVITRGNSVLPAESVSLKCERSYICITKDNTCESMTKPVKKKVQTSEEVYEVLADELADCWWMFGEGEIDYVGKDMIGKLYCSICAQIAFDDSVQEIFSSGEIEKETLYQYMRVNNYSEDETYLEHLYDTNDLEFLKSELSKQDVEFGPVDISQQYYVMMGITSDVSAFGWGVVGAGLVGLIAFTPFIGPAAGIVTGSIFTAGGGVAGGIAGPFVVKGLSGNDYLSPSIIKANSEEFEALNCKSITTLA